MADIKQYIFFDFEMLCSDQGMAFEKMEAIRLGAVKYELDSEEISYFDRFIRPENRNPLTNFCKTLTGIDDTDLEKASDFKDVFADFLEWIGGLKKSQYFSWSPSDLSRLKIDSLKHSIPERTIRKIETRYTDFQDIFKKRVSKNNISVEDGLSLYGLEFLGEKHNPMYDAYNTLRIYQSYLCEPIKSDMIMLKQFIFEVESPEDIRMINLQLSKQLQQDAKEITEQLREIYRIRDVKKLLKPIKRLSLKYENVFLNRSGIFTKQNVCNAECFLSFYQDFLFTFEEHFAHSSRVVILHEYMLNPLKQLISTNT
ncbi:3'-5' exonuclease [Metabacillus endolithicus]|uniref:Exonuclease domain-containing protein n=1 Tax=Metabacillus endolithicus TaxID=1535204 RepID=A0ABW5BXC2_9BACI|nr:3'-5' exonuclease [Metabacillus endolithicus]UPG62876.1 exonuclease domain-containing protein [Metabacillus endolithicus]